MCVTDVGQVVKLAEGGGTAEIESGGRRRSVSLAVLVLEGTAVAMGDWVQVHTGLAVEVVDEATAARLLAFEPRLGP